MWRPDRTIWPFGCTGDTGHGRSQEYCSPNLFCEERNCIIENLNQKKKEKRKKKKYEEECNNREKEREKETYSIDTGVQCLERSCFAPAARCDGHWVRSAVRCNIHCFELHAQKEDNICIESGKKIIQFHVVHVLRSWKMSNIYGDGRFRNSRDETSRVA